MYVPWYDKANIKYVSQKYGFNEEDSIDYIYFTTSEFDKIRIRALASRLSSLKRNSVRYNKEKNADQSGLCLSPGN